jgi:uncharacterized protein
MAEHIPILNHAAMPEPVSLRVHSLDWPEISASLHGWGYATTGVIFSPEECLEIATGYDTPKTFRSHVIMARHGFGRGEYKYYSNPLPERVVALRTAFYPMLAGIANQWQEASNKSIRFPDDYESFLKRCHQAGQQKPTPLLLKYEEGDYNCLHQDLYGELFFPLQIAILLSCPGKDFQGGEFVLTEQRPRMQSRVQVVPLQQGEGVIFAVNQRPVAGQRGPYQVTMRHGVSRLRSGKRFTLGIIFHDAL